MKKSFFDNGAESDFKISNNHNQGSARAVLWYPWVPSKISKIFATAFRCWVLCRPLITISKKFVSERDLRVRGGFGMGFFGDPFPGDGGQKFFILGQKSTSIYCSIITKTYLIFPKIK